MMSQKLQKILSMVILTTLLGSCAPLTDLSIQLPSMEIPLRGSRPTQPTFSTPLATTSTPIQIVTATQPAPVIPAATATVTPLPYLLYIEPSVPDALRESAEKWNLPPAGSATIAELQLGVALPSDPQKVTWIYALVAPFPTTLDGVTLSELEAAWKNSTSGPFDGSPFWMTDSTLSAFKAFWGEPGDGAVTTVSADELVNALWKNQPAWGIVPFESLDPKLKVLTVDDQSPIRNNFDEDSYPLKLEFSLIGDKANSFKMPPSNRDPSRLTVVLMTGVTALVRATATRMEIAGVDFPALDIGESLRTADITHISNEIPFYANCPPPDPRQEGLVFCSSPKYIELLELVGTDVVELTGNHFQDYGSEATLFTLAMYDERGWPTYGGGSNLEDSRKAAFLTHNGNRFAFIGCNPVGPQNAWAADEYPGAAPCDDYEWMKTEISDLTGRGYIVIATFQYFEYSSFVPTEQHVDDFRAIADAGATIVNGSQAHVPQAMEFYGNSFVHYGLGNLFFDQMTDLSRPEFIDRHTFYNGNLISTELLTAMLEDYARPRPMTPDERKAFLEVMFQASNWTVTEMGE